MNIEKNENEMLVELDLHGVLVDIYFEIQKRILEEGYKDFSFDNVKTYECRNKGIGCPKVIIDKYYLVSEVFTESKLYEGAKEFVDWLTKLPNIKVVIHSIVYSPELIPIVEDYISSNFENVGTIVEYGSIKNMIPNADICIEDSLPNLAQSLAPIKYIVARHHNKQENNQKYDNVFDESIIVTDYKEIVEDLCTILPEYFVKEKDNADD